SGSIGLNRPVTINLEDTVEAYGILCSEIRFLEGELEMGGFMKSENEGRIYFDFVERLASAAASKPTLIIRTQAMDRKDMQRLKDAGLDCLSIQMEVWDPELFAEVLPGKAKHAPREKWLESFQDAVDVFGAGNVGGKIIAGLTLIPSNGHQTWQEARDCHIEGNTWLIKNSVMPVFTNLRLPPGSVYAGDASNRDKLPPTEYYLDVAMAHHTAMMEYDLYETLNRLLYCGLCCVEMPYAGELGMLELAGDVGSWMAPVIPKEENWIARFLASVAETV
ncbi:MAG: hypothetical protein Q7O66_13400, partial [Dehalococcoidia bacterium]|nr:hypothetical protein [Dehalococcoidia bacterium]